MMIGSNDELAAALVVEIEVAEVARSVEFYRRLGFAVVRVEVDFASLRWRDEWLFVAAGPGAAGNGASGTNLRVLVDDVDACWRVAQELAALVVRPIGDRSYGLRDFTIRDPDGFALRFAARLR